MTTTLTALEGKLERLIKQSSALQPKTWHLILETGQAIPEETRAKIRPGDQVIIREYPRGMFEGV